MLLSLSQWLLSMYPDEFSFLRVFQYITFRAVMDPLHTKTSGPDGGHLDQLGRFTGTLVLDGDRLAIVLLDRCETDRGHQVAVIR